MHSPQALLFITILAIRFFQSVNAWEFQFWVSQTSCVNTPGAQADRTISGEAYQPNNCTGIGLDHKSAMEISDWDDGCNATIFRDVVIKVGSGCPTNPAQISGDLPAIIWGPYSKQDWIEKDPTGYMKKYNKTCLGYDTIGAGYQMSYICPPNTSTTATSEQTSSQTTSTRVSPTSESAESTSTRRNDTLTVSY